jgi:hypothetical protein
VSGIHNLPKFDACPKICEQAIKFTCNGAKSLNSASAITILGQKTFSSYFLRRPVSLILPAKPINRLIEVTLPFGPDQFSRKEISGIKLEAVIFLSNFCTVDLKSTPEKVTIKFSSLFARLRGLALLSAMFLSAIPAFPQILSAGLKGGFNFSWTRSDDSDFRKAYHVHPVPGFNAGAVFSFQLKKRYYLHTELLYSTKGRVVTGDLALRDEVTYRYIDIPVIYQIHFKGKLGSKSTRQYNWFAGIGPNFSYWLGGKGTVTHFEITDHDVPEIPYALRFGTRPPEEEGESGLVYITDARRVQVGVNIDAGVWVEPMPNRKIMVDLRFELGHSWLADAQSADYVFPQTYSRNLQSRNLGLRLSVIYLVQSNLDKKVRNKGKSDVVQKGKMLKRRK